MVKLLGIFWAEATRDDSQVTKKKLISLPTPRTKQEVHCLVYLDWGRCIFYVWEYC